MSVDLTYGLEDRYRRESGRVYLNGVDALVRLPLEQARRDRAAGLRTAGFISGYRGSPLGTYDLALWKAKDLLAGDGVVFQPGVNEDLAATAVWGTQQAPLMERPRVDGVFALWYGKGPGVDRSSDPLKHGNFAGSSTLGGVLVVAGDDPGAKSSSLAHQSEPALVHCAIPVLSPADVQEIIDFGLYGWALSRYSGSWVALRCVTDTVESAATVGVGIDRISVVIPETGPDDRDVQWNVPPLDAERRVFEQRLPAVQAFVAANHLDRTYLESSRRRLGIVAPGKGYLDVRQALDEMGIDEDRATDLGLALYKPAMTWPLEPDGVRRFASGRSEILVVEEKRPLVESQIAAILYNVDDRPVLTGKSDRDGSALLPSVGELSPAVVIRALTQWLDRVAPGTVAPAPKVIPLSSPPVTRRAAFCAGCPHNTSTVVPEGSLSLGGIGCHGMAVGLPQPRRRALAYTHMGGEGANWIGISPFTDTAHVFQNLGDGTYFHSGLLAVRAAVAAGVNITYKILANGAVAMTGGQPIEGETIESEVVVPDIVRQLVAEGVGPVVVVSDDPTRYRGVSLADGVEVRDRADLDQVQRTLRETPGVTAIVYDQTCAAEARRLRKRGQFPDPDRRIVINEMVCEGCGDCSVQSNCIAIEPVETEFGRKRTINQHACNKDYSCLKGYCPAFAVVEGGSLRRPGSDGGKTRADATSLPPPNVATGAGTYNILITGVGGTGVVTVGAILGVAAFLDGAACSVLDVTGLAQKNGSVTSHVKVSEREEIHARRVGQSSADLLIGCDLVVSVEPANLGALAAGRTSAVVNTEVSPTSDFASQPDMDLTPDRMAAMISSAIGEDRLHCLDAKRMALGILGEEMATNLFLVGYAAQKGLLPVSLDALERAIELNGAAVDMNKAALMWGRIAAHQPEVALEAASGRAPTQVPAPATDLDELVRDRVGFLVAYQDAAYAKRYSTVVERVARREREVTERSDLSGAVARSLFGLMAYKDEYEVARLYTDGAFSSRIDAMFEGDFKVKLSLAPQRFFRTDPSTGRVRKVMFGPWIFPALRVLARLKFLRGGRFDVFGRTPHRKAERALIAEYERTVDAIVECLSPACYDTAVELALWPRLVRGFGVIKDEGMARAEQSREELLGRLESESSSEEVLA